MTTDKTSRRCFLARLPAAGIAVAAFPHTLPAAEAANGDAGFNVRNFGARGDGNALDTAALQKAVEACAQSGGGTVYFPAGRYLSGTIFLKSHVRLRLDPGATLLGSANLEDYPPTVSSTRSYTDNYTERSLIYGEGLEQIALEGRGIIDGRGGTFKGAYKVRPFLVRLIGCRDVSVRGLTLKDSAMWVQHYLACDGVCIDGVTVVSKCNANNDGIDIDSCRRVRIANCDIRSGDDAIVLKSTLARACRDVVVSNCILNSDCNAFKLGTESNGGFENIVLSNCVMYDTRLAGIALEEVDGGILDRVSISNVTMDDVKCPIFIRLGNRARPFRENMEKPGMGALRNVSISNVQATGADSIGCCIAGLPGRPVENVTLSNIKMSFSGKGTKEQAQRQPAEKPDAYPEYSMFSGLPAYGLYCRHARNLVLESIEARVATPDLRPSLVCEDVHTLEISGWSTGTVPSDAAAICFNDVSDALLRGCRRLRTASSFLRIGGKNSTGIEIDEMDSKAVEIQKSVQPGAVRMRGSGPKTRIR